ncbi:MAG: Holliday junction branch migration protein RuvA [Lachnospiraceae bacterium]|nr:Holliday junction branch migration protein RuvA [Lachnospiraceae bacterium]
MIYYVKGILTEYTEEGVVLEAGGVGYQILLPPSLMAELPAPGEEVKLYTYYQVGEDSQKLYGFKDRDSRSLFLQIIKVSGIGPKLAVSVLGTLGVDELRLAVIAGDVKAISQAPGMGKKTAEKLILELKDKIDAASLISPGDAKAGSAPVIVSDAFSEAVAALQALGYSSSEALKTVRSLDAEEDWTVDDILQAAFRKLAAF